MVWVKSSDDFMLDERIQAVDCCADSALRAAYEVCNRIETDGVFYLDQLITRWSPAKGNRRRLRKAIEDLIGVGLVHRLEHAEALRRYTMAVEKGHQFGLQPAKNRHYFAIVDYLETQPSADEKRAKREQNRKYVAEHRQQKKDAAVRALRKTTPDPGPEPELNDHNYAHAPKGPELNPTAHPSIASNQAADQDAGSWLRTELERRRRQKGKAVRWNPKHQPHIDAVIRKAIEAEGDTFAILTAALDAFFADATQDPFAHIPPGLDHGFATYAGPYLERAAAEASDRRIAEKNEEYHRVKAEYEARAEADRQRKHGGPHNGQGPLAGPLAETTRSLAGNVD